MKIISQNISIIVCLALLSVTPNLVFSDTKENANLRIKTQEKQENPPQKAQSKPQPEKTRKPATNSDSKLDKQLLNAASKGNLDAVSRLLKAGANIEARDGSLGGTPLIWASFMGHTPVVKLLITKGADYNAQNNKAWTPLLLACSKGHIQIAKLLLDKGANIDARSSDGWTPLSIAFSKKNSTLFKLLLYYCAKSPWATVKVNSVDGKGCLRVRNQPTKSANTVKCVKKGEVLSLTGIWTKENWVHISKPVLGWAPGHYVKTADLPARKRAVLNLRIKNVRATPGRHQPRRAYEPVDNPDDMDPEMDIQSEGHYRKHMWR